MYAIYLRKSRKDLDLEALGKGETLARHRQELLELARDRNLKVTKIYEEVVSGESLADRPQMQQMLVDIASGKYKGVIVMEIERLGRGNQKEQGMILETFYMTNTFIITPQKTYDPENENDEIFLEFGFFMSRQEFITIRRRMKRGLLASIKEGNYLGSYAPYGYDVVRINKKERMLKPNEQAQYVEMMFNWFVNERMTAGKIAKKLTKMQIPTKTGKAEWNRGTVKDILKNDSYTGKIRWNRRKVTKEFVNGDMKKVKHRNLSEDYLIVEGKHQPIISQELFDKAKEIFENNPVPVKSTVGIKNPFAGLMYCKRCGKGIAYQGYSHKENTRPRMVHKESVHCKVKSSYFDDVMDSVMLALKMHEENFKLMRSNKAELKRQEEYEKMLEGMYKEMKKLKDRQRRIFELYEDGSYTREEFDERKNIYIDKIAELQQLIDIEENNQPEKIDYEDMIFRFNQLINLLQSDISPKKKNDLLKEMIQKIEYDCEDRGRLKGGVISIDITLRE